MRLPEALRALRAHTKPDGCTAVPDLFYARCCNRHDLDYLTGADEHGTPVTRAQADARLFRCMSAHPRSTRYYSVLLPALFWLGVRAFGWLHWRNRAPRRAKYPVRR